MLMYNERGRRSVASSLRSFGRDCHINVSS